MFLGGSFIILFVYWILRIVKSSDSRNYITFEKSKNIGRRRNIVYSIKNPKTGKMYIGLTKNGQKRFVGHEIDFKNGKSSKFYECLRRDGICITQCLVCILYEGLDVAVKEREYIKQYDTYSNGYNNSYGGETGNCRRYIYR